MPSLSDTITRLQRFRAANARPAAPGSTRLGELKGFGSNPGALKAWTYLPEGLADSAPLVVVLHGCTQTAAGYDHGSGWSEMAERHGFALLFPEQTRANNANLCFNWFEPGDIRRGAGEALSIRQMVASLVDTHGLDSRRVFVTGLSAGGAMTSVMLATYPEVFAGGAIIAGLPYDVAAGVPQAFDRMRGHGLPAERELQALVRRASDHEGAWPTISVWHGDADRTVEVANAEAIVSQWRKAHGLPANPTRTDMVDGYPRRLWCDASGRALIDEVIITGMGHGTPLSPGDEGGGVAGPYMLDVGISSTGHIAKSWGLTDGVVHMPRRAPAPMPAPAPNPTPTPALVETRRSARQAGPAPAAPAASGVGKVIEDALRAAGLMR